MDVSGGVAPLISLDESYAVCRKATLASGSNLAWGFWILPRDQRRAMDALYAFARASDDLVDSPGEKPEPLKALRDWRAAVETALDDPSAAARLSPILPALSDSARRFSVDRSHLLAILDGCELDATPRTFRTLEETTSYCRLVASAVGLACLEIWGCDPSASPRADALGVALQWTNILRDLKEDASRGRCYVPEEVLVEHGLAPADWFARASDEQFRAVVSRVAKVAQAGFRESEGLESLVRSPGRHVCRLMREAYRELLTTLASNPLAPRARRVRLGWFGRLKAIARTVWPPVRGG